MSTHLVTAAIGDLDAPNAAFPKALVHASAITNARLLFSLGSECGGRLLFFGAEDGSIIFDLAAKVES
jgi:hypothetical protein